MADSNTTLVLSEAQLEQRDLLQKKAGQLHAALRLVGSNGGLETLTGLPEPHHSNFMWLLEDLADEVHAASISVFDVVPGVAHA